MAQQKKMLAALLSTFLLVASATESVKPARKATVYLYNTFGSRLSPAASSASQAVASTGSGTYSSRSAAYDNFEQPFGNTGFRSPLVSSNSYDQGYGSNEAGYGGSNDYDGFDNAAQKQPAYDQPRYNYNAQPAVPAGGHGGYAQQQPAYNPEPAYNKEPAYNYNQAPAYEPQAPPRVPVKPNPAPVALPPPPPVPKPAPSPSANYGAKLPQSYTGGQQVSKVTDAKAPEKQGSFLSETYNDGGYAAGFDKGYAGAGGCGHDGGHLGGGHLGGGLLGGGHLGGGHISAGLGKAHGAGIGLGAGKVIAAKTQALADVGSSIGASIGQATKGLVNGIQGLRNLAQAGRQLKNGLTRALQVIPAGILGAVNVASSAKAAVSNSLATAGKATAAGLSSGLAAGKDYQGSKPYAGGYSNGYTSTYNH